MTDNYEKKIDKHYTYTYKQEFGINNWSIVRKEHEPGEKPKFDSRVRYVSCGLSEGSARTETIELQLKEITRRTRTY